MNETRRTTKTTQQGSWRRTRRVCWSNWTFGPWYAEIGRKRIFGIDLGPLAFYWEKRLPPRRVYDYSRPRRTS